MLPATPSYRRPPDLVYAASERPPWGVLFFLAGQHAALALALTAYVLASARIGGLDPETTRHLVAATVLCMAVTTFLNSWGGAVGSGFLIVNIPDPGLLLFCGPIAAQHGLGALVAVGLVYGSASLCAAFVIPRLRSLFPPTVAGVVVTMIGVSIISPGLTHLLGLDATGGVDGVETMIGLSALAAVVVLSVWGSRRMGLFAVLIGLAIGVALSALCGRLTGLESLSSMPLAELPEIPRPVFGLDVGTVLVIALMGLVVQVDTLGSVVLMHKLEDADWRRADMRAVGGGLRAAAVGNLAGALLGAYPGATSSAGIALCRISLSTSRAVGLAVAGLLAVVAFLPKVTLALTLIPTPVIGAIELYAAAYLVVSGMELVVSRALDTRAMFMVGLAFIVGTGVVLLPQIALNLPGDLRGVAQNGIVTAGIVAIVLNSVFRLGTSRSVVCPVAPEGEQPIAAQVIDFVEHNGAAWNARRDVVARAAQAALEAAEAVAASGGARRLVALRGSFDEYNLDIELVHSGEPLPLQPNGVAHPGLLDLDDETFDASLDTIMAGVSGQLLKSLADRLVTGRQAGQAFVRLHFDH